ncbi:MAG: nitroreductase family protein, partial [Holophagales bacterium]|nr:nitroreductase family protein [Holophagales bacterium]
EAESPIALLALEPRTAPRGIRRWRPSGDCLGSLKAASLAGGPSRISRQHRHWPGLLAAIRASRRRLGDPPVPAPQPGAAGPPTTRPPTVWPREILDHRRSRSAYEDRPIGWAAFEALLGRIAGEGAGSSFPRPGELATLLFVHRVVGLEPGLYAAVDGSSPVNALRNATRGDFEWRPASEGAAGWRLLCLFRGDGRRASTGLAGHQPAAGDGAFTALFLARLDTALSAEGGFAYRRLHWHAGELGHRLYLEAEAQGLGATGLGGFFDERLRDLLGLGGDAWWPLYLLAVGGRSGSDPVLEPPYAHRLLDAEPVPASRGGWRPLEGRARV